MSPLVARLPDGPLDVVGDVHGELTSLERLLARLGYDSSAKHAEGRTLVLIGDLVDRGHDSPGVVRLARKLVAGGALCLLGNHELSLIRGEHKHGNGWFRGEVEPLGGRHTGNFDSVVLDSAEERAEFIEFFRSLPVALERDDVRIVHAAWHERSIAAARAGSRETFFERATRGGSLASDPREVRYQAERPRLLDLKAGAPAFDDELAELQLDKQAARPVSILLSGPERKVPSRQPFYAGGEWRFVERDRWWETYEGVPVIVGHYWRTRDPDDDVLDRPSVPPNEWWGRYVYCVDYSVGRRYSARASGTVAPVELAAVRWPSPRTGQRTVFFEGGDEIRLAEPG